MLWYSTLLLLVPAFILALVAQIKVRGAYAKYTKVPCRRGLSGASVARSILDRNGLHGVDVEEVAGNLTDHYDPRKKVLRLSGGVARGRNLAALGVAAHEAGHAIQDARGYLPLKVRSGIFPVASFSSMAAFPIFFIGFLLRTPFLIDLGILFFVFYVLFSVVTLPVEFNASRRAIATLSGEGLITRDEVGGARAVLNAAALTYVAAATMAVMQLLRLLILRSARD